MLEQLVEVLENEKTQVDKKESVRLAAIGLLVEPGVLLKKAGTELQALKDKLSPPKWQCRAILSQLTWPPEEQDLLKTMVRICEFLSLSSCPPSCLSIGYQLHSRDNHFLHPRRQDSPCTFLHLSLSIFSTFDLILSSLRSIMARSRLPGSWRLRQTAPH